MRDDIIIDKHVPYVIELNSSGDDLNVVKRENVLYKLLVVLNKIDGYAASSGDLVVIWHGDVTNVLELLEIVEQHDVDGITPSISYILLAILVV